ncbi:MAG: tRNA (adenosine(37)-N6)-dimethylallyltransferase MiaA [Burkholderiales bacterium]
MGPTASGKTTVAIELAKRFPVEIVSVDSAQIYRRMNIGTAKPDIATRLRFPHHLIDIIDPTQSYSAAQFRTDALSVMEDIAERGKIPLLAGGTMLYFKALSEGLSELPQADPATRTVIDAMAAEAGWPALHAELERVDPRTALRLDPNDSQRVQRALEVYYLTGKPMSELIEGEREQSSPFELLRIALLPEDRSRLHDRIAMRFEEMLELGLIAEVRELRSDYELSARLPSMRCVGYRQVWQYLDGKYGLSTLREKGLAATRQLAKRQLTWLRAMKDLREFDCLAEDAPEQVGDWLERELKKLA